MDQSNPTFKSLALEKPVLHNSTESGCSPIQLSSTYRVLKRMRQAGELEPSAWKSQIVALDDSSNDEELLPGIGSSMTPDSPPPSSDLEVEQGTPPPDSPHDALPISNAANPQSALHNGFHNLQLPPIKSILAHAGSGSLPHDQPDTPGSASTHSMNGRPPQGDTLPRSPVDQETHGARSINLNGHVEANPTSRPSATTTLQPAAPRPLTPRIIVTDESVNGELQFRRHHPGSGLSELNLFHNLEQIRRSTPPQPHSLPSPTTSSGTWHNRPLLQQPAEVQLIAPRKVSAESMHGRSPLTYPPAHQASEARSHHDQVAPRGRYPTGPFLNSHTPPQQAQIPYSSKMAREMTSQNGYAPPHIPTTVQKRPETVVRNSGQPRRAQSSGGRVQHPQPSYNPQLVPAQKMYHQTTIMESMAKAGPPRSSSSTPTSPGIYFPSYPLEEMLPGSFYHQQLGCWYAPAEPEPPKKRRRYSDPLSGMLDHLSPLLIEELRKMDKAWVDRDLRTFTCIRANANIASTQVLEYLSKKGYVRTEAKLREETALQQDASGRPIHRQLKGAERYEKSYDLLRKWVDDALDIYKPELRRLLWPIFIYAYLALAREHYQRQAGDFFDRHKDLFIREHSEDLRRMGSIRSPQHVQDNQLAQSYVKNKYRLTLTEAAYSTVILFLESIENEGGSAIISLMDEHMYIKPVNRAALGTERSLAAMLARGGADEDMPAEDEGIPGHNPGSANTARDMDTLPRLHLGALPVDQDLMEDVKAKLQEEDEKNVPKPGQSSLLDHYEQRIKQEPMEDGPARENVPLPPPLAREVMMEVQKVKENRDRFRIEGKTGGVGPGISVIMYTMHNTFDTVNCIDFSGDYTLIAIGTDQSYVRIWKLDGTALPNAANDPPSARPSSSRRLIGHAGPVYTVAFSPGTKNPDPDGPSTHSRYLLSCSADRTVRLWSLDLWQCLVAYRGHDKPVWDVSWGPYGHYFLTGSGDGTARMWSTDRIDPLRIFHGHEQDVDVVAWHPNSAYTFTGSSDRSVRMWDVNRGTAVRMFTGHTGNITALACAPDARTLASADDHGVIALWDLGTGRRTKVMRGHVRGGVWSLAWSVEGTVLASAGADGTVRIWDTATKPDTSATGKALVDGAAGAKPDGSASGGTAAGSGSGGTAAVGVGGGGVGGVSTGGKKSKKGEVVVSPDQISAFPTKKSPVYKIAFSGMNLCLAGGAYLP